MRLSSPLSSLKFAVLGVISASLLGFIVQGPEGSAKSGYSSPDGKTYPVALTFDDGPAGKLTQKALDVLAKHQIRGTFFVLGDRFGSEADRKANFPVLERMLAEGHIIGSHTYSHLKHSSETPEKAARNIAKATELLRPYLSPVLRLPYGDGYFRSKDKEKQKRNDRVMAMVKEAGFTHVAWDIDTNDWNPARRKDLVRSMMSQICTEKGGVILFHDVHPNTVDNLSSWIDIIKAAGHTIHGLDHFVPAAGKRMTDPDKECATCAPNPKPEKAPWVGELIQKIPPEKKAKPKGAKK